jgi:hemoglobin
MTNRPRIAVLLLSLLSLLAHVAWADGRFLATGGASSIEGAAGGGITPWAVLSGYGERGEWGADVFATRVETGDYRLDVAGIGASFDNRIELSYARQRFDLGNLARNLNVPESSLSQDIFGLKVACAQQQPKGDSLYQAPGRQAGITRMVEGMLLNIAADPRIVRHFEKVDIVRLRNKLVEQVCVEAGGPFTYTGDSMEESHKGQSLTRSDFNALVENLQAAMTAQGVAMPAQNRLLARLAPMRAQIIER